MEKESVEKVKQRALAEDMQLAIGYVLMLFGITCAGVIAVIFQSKIALTIAIVLLLTSGYVRYLIVKSVKRIKSEITSDPSVSK